MSARKCSRSLLFVLVATAVTSGHCLANGWLIPVDKTVPPLGIVYQRLNIAIQDQAAVTRVEQEFQNHTSRPLEAFYCFPLPADAGIKDFAMWIDGKRTTAEMVEAPKARQVYEDIVRRMKDPGLLEHMNDNLWRVRVFPVPANGRQKVEISYSQVASRDAGITEYIYPLKTSNQAMTTKEDFTIRVELKSSSALKSVYSPSHDISVNKEGDHKAIVGFEAKNYTLDKDFRLYWTTSDKDVGLSFLTYRESPGDPGYFLLMLTPSTEMPKDARVPRDIIFVVDTSGSMKGEKFEQAQNALKFCLKSLDKADRFGLIAFATTVNPFAGELKKVDDDAIRQANKWIDDLSAAGGTAISEALDAALKLRTSESRNFTVVFLTDGQPTIGETQPQNILEAVKKKNDANTRIFVFGVGDDVNTHLLDQLAEISRATSVYVRPKENLETKVSSFYSKISHPVFANPKLTVANESIKLSEMYPPTLPDLFHGGQLLVFGRYTGHGHSAIHLEGKVGEQAKKFVHEIFMPQEKRENDFLPGLWARRKIGYLLDQIRLKGENKELVDEVIALSKRHGIATPYTSYLIVPDQKIGPIPMPRPGDPRPLSRADRLSTLYETESRSLAAGAQPPTTALNPGSASAGREQQMLARGRTAGGAGLGGTADASGPPGTRSVPKAEASVQESLELYSRRYKADRDGGSPDTQRGSAFALQDQAGERAVDVAQALDYLKSSTDAPAQALKKVGQTSFMNIAGVWIDQSHKKDAKLITIEYLGDTYFNILRLIPEAKSVFALGERVVWITPSGAALAIDPTGKQTLTDEEIKTLFRK